MTLSTTDPTTGDQLATYPAMTPERVEHLLDRSCHAAEAWGLRPIAERTAVLSSVAHLLRAHSEELAALIAAEMGKPLAQGRGEVEKSAATAEYYAAHAAEFLADVPVELGQQQAWVAREPLGVIFAVMPWNFPVWQVMRFLLPALAAGNGVLLKHASIVTGSSLRMEELLREAGLPEGVFSSLVIEEAEVPETADRIVRDDRVAAVTLTGSNRAGQAVGRAAGESVKKAVLELGGSDAFVVLADADVELAAERAVAARFTNAGQSCVCAKRFIVVRDVADRFVEAFVRRVEEIVVGHPTQEETTMGPLARPDLVDTIAEQVESSVAAGATLLTGGRRISGPGNFYEPTVLTGVRPGMRAFDEETFGPLAAVTVAEDAEDAVRLADDSPFGLGLSVWSGDRAQALSVARRITSGAVFVNAVVASDPRLPFGGTRHSGHGRELAEDGMLEFVNRRTYVVSVP